MRMPKSRVLVLTAMFAAAVGLLAMGLMNVRGALGQATDVEVVEQPAASPPAAPVEVTAPEPLPPASPPEAQQPAAGPESGQAPVQQMPSAGDGGLQGALSIPPSTVCVLATGWALSVLGAAMAIAGRLRFRRR